MMTWSRLGGRVGQVIAFDACGGREAGYVRRSHWLRATGLTLAIACLAVASGCRSIAPAGGKASGIGQIIPSPSNDRDWAPKFATLSTAEFDGDEVHVKNIRNCSYYSEETYVVDHYDKTFDLNRLQAVDFIVVPFKLTPSLAHTMLSFEFAAPAPAAGEAVEAKKEYLSVSVEARMERGETYSALRGAARQFELMYVVADERDVLRLRTEHRDVDVYVYRVRATPEQVKLLFQDVMDRTNQLAIAPEFYDTIRNNCTNNIVRHINKLRPGRIPWDPRVVLPGLSDQLAYDLGLLDTSKSFSQLKRDAHINDAARQAANLPEFSTLIRR